MLPWQVGRGGGRVQVGKTLIHVEILVSHGRLQNCKEFMSL